LSDGWSPSAEVLATSRAAVLVAAAGASDFDELLRRSIDNPEWYWDFVVHHLGLPFAAPYDVVVDESDGPEWARWFVGGSTNVASFCIDRWLDDPTRPAVDWHGEDGERRTWTVLDLHRETEAMAALLRSRGVVAGDRVALLLPMVPEAVSAFLAVAKIGAVAVPLFTGFGPEAVRVRVRDADAVAVLTADAGLRRGAPAPLATVVAEALDGVTTVHTVVVLERVGALPMPVTGDAVEAMPWPTASEASSSSTTLALPSDHELLVAYTSGTTGRPKGAVHVHGGMPVKIATEGAFHHDLGSGDVLTWVSDMGWIMGPYQIVAALANGATLCLVEGVPDFPGPDRMWRIVAESRITTLGMSPTLVRTLRTAGDRPVVEHDLDSLRVLSSTGEPWNETPWHWYFEVPGRSRCPVINISGGTEVGGALLGGHPVQEIRPMSLVGPSLGMAVDVFDADGHPVRGRTGELVCRRPWPGMTKGLYHDPERYHATYWDRWPGVWVHGDFASIDDGQWFIHGRSDDTMNIAGKRVGPVEPESALVAHPAVVEAAAIGLPHDVTGEALHVFVVVAPDATPSSELAQELRLHVGALLGASFRPASVTFVEMLPKTRSGKVMRRVVRALALDEDPGDLASLDDAAALDSVRRALGVDRESSGS
jgi:acetyl-CoA synthetase